MIFLKNNTFHNLFFALCSTLWTAALFVLPDFVGIPIDNFLSVLSVLLQFGLQFATLFLLLYAANCSKYLFSVFFPLLAILGAVLSYYKYAYKITLTPMLIDATLHNDLKTSLDVIPFALVLYVLFSLAISLLFVWYRLKKTSNNYPIISFILPIILLAVILNSNERIRNSILRNFPYNVYSNFKEYYRFQAFIAEKRTNPAPDITCERNDSLTVVLVLGESLRADHLSLNGYYRQTTPNLDKKERLISYPNIYSPYTITGRSIPHILTRADSAHLERAYTETSFVPLFKKCGFKTYWLANQESADYYIALMKECDSLIYVHPGKTVFTFAKWLDEDLLPHTDNMLSKNGERELLILHTIGSHWYFNSHFPDSFAHYQPIAKTKVLKQCTAEEMINSYDNTVLYTDFFLNELIKRLENRNAILLFLSDHGEALGEDGQWLHANETLPCKNPACFIWYSSKYEELYGDKIAALKQNREKKYQTDFLFHSILSAGNVPADLIEKKLDIFTNNLH